MPKDSWKISEKELPGNSPKQIKQSNEGQSIATKSQRMRLAQKIVIREKVGLLKPNNCQCRLLFSRLITNKAAAIRHADFLIQLEEESVT